jgi:hypothetical protein
MPFFFLFTKQGEKRRNKKTFKFGASGTRAVGFRDRRFTLTSSEESKAGRKTGRITYKVHLMCG